MREREREKEKENKLHYDYMGLIFRIFGVQIWIYLCFYGEIYQPHFFVRQCCIFGPDHHVARTNTVPKILWTSRLTP